MGAGGTRQDEILWRRDRGRQRQYIHQGREHRWKQSGIRGDVRPVTREEGQARKCALLRHCLGQEGQRIFATLTLSDDKYVTATAALKAHFSSGRSRRMHRFEFRQRTQKPGETVAHYVSALCELAGPCDFGTLEDGLIVDQLIEKTSCTQLRERLLLEPDSMTLADALVIGKQLETAVMEVRKLGSCHDAPVVPINTVQASQPSFKLCPCCVGTALIP
uniref:Retrotransposon gag domain-containing protein n=1 Tax=Sparus aurata TaxID=8175 RepID=A0A671TQZ6_SPAAU